VSQYIVEVEDTYNHITYETMERIIESIHLLRIKRWKTEDIQFLFSLMYWSGLRVAEAIKLQKEDFHLKTRRLVLHNTKTKLIDKAIIPMTFVAEVTEFLKDKPSGDLFPDLYYKAVYRWMKRLGLLLAIPAWTTPRSKTKEMTVCHAMRKSIGKNLLAGVHIAPDNRPYSILEISKLLRHKKPSMTEEHYLKVSDDAMLRRY